MSEPDGGDRGFVADLYSKLAVRVASDWDGVDPVDLLVELARSLWWNPSQVVAAMHEAVLRVERPCDRQ